MQRSSAPKRRRVPSTRWLAAGPIAWLLAFGACAVPGPTMPREASALPPAREDPLAYLPSDRVATIHAELAQLSLLLPLQSALEALFAPNGSRELPERVLEAQSVDAAVSLHDGTLRTLLVLDGLAPEELEAHACERKAQLAICCTGACDGFAAVKTEPTSAQPRSDALFELVSELPETPAGDALRERLSEDIVGVLLELRELSLRASSVAEERVRIELSARFGLEGSAGAASMLLRSQAGQLAEQLEALGPDTGAADLDAMRIELRGASLHATLELSHATLRLCAALLAQQHG